MEIINFEGMFPPVVRFLSIVTPVTMVVDDDQTLHLINVNVILFLKQQLGRALQVTCKFYGE